MTYQFCQLGLIPYKKAFDLQRKLVEVRYEGQIDDALLVLEHPPTITLGRFGKIENVLVGPSELEKRGIDLCNTNRGGDVTFHCPGQLVVYPIVSLRDSHVPFRNFLYKLEGVAIQVLTSFNIAAERWAEHHGIWVDGRQIGAIGLHVSRGITMHGMAINVNPALESFEVINLCGLPGKKATSMAQQLGHEMTVGDVTQQMLASFSDVFGVELQTISPQQIMGECNATKITPLV